MKIVIIGCGSIGRRHARNLHEIGGHELLLVDSDPERAEALVRELGGRSFRASEDAYAETPALAVICSPTSFHLEMAWEAIESGCHVFVEKPLSDSMIGMRELIDAAERRRRVLVIGYNFRFDRVVRQAREWVNEGKAGRITSARFHFGSYLPWRHADEDYRCGYGARRELGGGVILDAVHEFDMAIWFFGMPDAVYAHGGKFSDLQIDVEDTAGIVMSYADKVVSIHLDYVQRPAERRFEVIGTRGRVRADVFARTAEYFDGKRRVWRQADEMGTLDESYKSEIQRVIDCVEGRARAIVDGHIAAQSQLLAEKAKESIRSGLAVPVNARVQEVCAG
jgi:predicted dehydrogenase